MTISTNDIATMNRTARAFGAVGNRPTVVTQWVVANIETWKRLLDFGAGPQAQQTEILLDWGYMDVIAHEIGQNMRHDIHAPEALKHQYDVVMLSNVLNVQPTVHTLLHTIVQAANVTKPGGIMVANFPKEPRKGRMASMDVQQVRSALLFAFREVEVVEKDCNIASISRRSPLFICKTNHGEGCREGLSLNH